MIRQWYLLIPLALVGLEAILWQSKNQFEAFFFIAQRDERDLTALQTLFSLFRVSAGYVLLGVVWENFVNLTAWLIGRKIPNPCMKIASFLMVYGIAIEVIALLFPKPSGIYRVPLHYQSFGLMAIALVIAITRWKYRIQRDETNNRWAAVMALVAGLLVWVTSADRWEVGEHGVRGTTLTHRSPSFILFSLDSVPADFFFEDNADFSAMPYWRKRWHSKAITFKNAYSLTNSTYTSWYSVLGGKHPLTSGIRWLFPLERREPSIDNFLPKRLSERGYRTVYLTDCAVTCYMENDFGFQEMYQPAKTFLGCGRSILTSLHPMLLFLPGLFPEVDNYCSYYYNPDRFFEDIVLTTLDRLDRSDQPYFLVIHSCLTNGMLKHVPPRGSYLRQELSHTHYSQAQWTFMLSLRWGDTYLDRVLERAANSPHHPWQILLSDHGSRVVRGGQPTQSYREVVDLTHANGYPVSRYQYNVPLALIPPNHQPPHGGGTDFKGMIGEHQRVVYLPDLYPTIMELAGVPSDEQSLFHSLLQETPSRDPMVLISAHPVEPSYEKLIEDFKSYTRFDRSGIYRFSEKSQEIMSKNGGMAILDFPYRLLHVEGTHPQLFNELLDPHNDRDISRNYPRLTQRLFKDLKLKMDAKLQSSGLFRFVHRWKNRRT